MIFFDLNKLAKLANNNTRQMLHIMLGGKTKHIITHKNFVGSSYLLDVKSLYDCIGVDISFIRQYLNLAARRDYSIYKLYNSAALDTTFFPEIDFTKIKYNPLLSIVGNNLFFYFEEQYQKLKERKH